MERIKVLIIEPGEKPVLTEISHTLETLQEIIGGTIQAVYPFDDPVAILCDDEGKFKGYVPNRALTGEDGEPYDILAGTFIICGLTAENFGSLSDELAGKLLGLRPEELLPVIRRLEKHRPPAPARH